MSHSKNRLAKAVEWTIGLIAFTALFVTGRAEAVMVDVSSDSDSVDFTDGTIAYVDVGDVDNDGGGTVHSE